MEAYLSSRASRGEFSGSALVARGGQVMLSEGTRWQSRQSYAALLDQEVFRKLDMTDTGLAADDGDIPGRAIGYTRTSPGDRTPALTEAWARPSLALSAGGLYSTVAAFGRSFRCSGSRHDCSEFHVSRRPLNSARTRVTHDSRGPNTTSA
jgi:CubicO group peptidase (beta-lactamase class C family)